MTFYRFRLLNCNVADSLVKWNYFSGRLFRQNVCCPGALSQQSFFLDGGRISIDHSCKVISEICRHSAIELQVCLFLI